MRRDGRHGFRDHGSTGGLRGGRPLAARPGATPSRPHHLTIPVLRSRRIPTPPPRRYGEFVVLSQHDHISTCKPADPSDPAYARLMAFLRQRVRDLKVDRAQAATLDHMEAAAM